MSSVECRSVRRVSSVGPFGECRVSVRSWLLRCAPGLALRTTGRGRGPVVVIVALRSKELGKVLRNTCGRGSVVVIVALP